ncbi:MAG: aminotransferase class V-fold PLP-dependent enzyme [Gammaproteobacteria bacterium]|nr:aminotransferase class V-fold PLP-dependent enzyme [Gammaproteobacteria bacterium]
MKNMLEPSEQEIREMIQLTTEKIISFLDELAEPVVFDMETVREEAYQASETIPEQQSSLDDILDDLFENKIPYALQTSSPGFMAYIPGGGIFHSGLAELIVKVTNRYVGIDITAPFLNQIETDVLKWFCTMIGYSEKSGGTLTSGGSLANLTAVICARTLIMGDKFSKGTVYASGYVHHSMWKAFHAAGISSSQIRNIKIDTDFRMDIQALEQAIEQDIEAGFTPLMIVATAGSTNTGSVDPLNEIAKIAKRSNAWYHIDAAYGGFFTMTERGKKCLLGIEQADSITLDPHKGLFLPYGTGAFLVKDREDLKKVFSHNADYIPDKTSAHELWDFSEMSLELTRPFRGLGVWLPFKMLGAGTFKKALEEKLELADYFYDCIEKSGDWEIIAKNDLSLSVFRYNHTNYSVDQLNKINRKIINYVNDKGRTILSGTLIDNNFVIRNCILSFRSHKMHVDWLIDDLNEALSELRGQFT